jgi:hypothetical protein
MGFLSGTKGQLKSMDGYLPLEESFDKTLDRSHLPDDVEVLKDIIQGFCQTIEYLKSELSILRRFQYGQRSERLKKKRLQ